LKKHKVIGLQEAETANS